MIAAAALMTTRMPHGECPMTAKVDFLLTVRMPISVENPRAEEYRRHLHRRGYGRQDRRGGSSPRPAKGLIPWRRRCCPGRITWTCRESSSTRRAAPRWRATSRLRARAWRSPRAERRQKTVSRSRPPCRRSPPTISSSRRYSSPARSHPRVCSTTATSTSRSRTTPTVRSMPTG